MVPQNEDTIFTYLKGREDWKSHAANFLEPYKPDTIIEIRGSRFYLRDMQSQSFNFQIPECSMWRLEIIKPEYRDGYLKPSSNDILTCSSDLDNVKETKRCHQYILSNDENAKDKLFLTKEPYHKEMIDMSISTDNARLVDELTSKIGLSNILQYIGLKFILEHIDENMLEQVLSSKKMQFSKNSLKQKSKEINKSFETGRELEKALDDIINNGTNLVNIKVSYPTASPTVAITTAVKQKSSHSSHSSSYSSIKSFLGDQGSLQVDRRILGSLAQTICLEENISTKFDPINRVVMYPKDILPKALVSFRKTGVTVEEFMTQRVQEVGFDESELTSEVLNRIACAASRIHRDEYGFEPFKRNKRNIFFAEESFSPSSSNIRSSKIERLDHDKTAFVILDAIIKLVNQNKLHIKFLKLV